MNGSDRMFIALLKEFLRIGSVNELELRHILCVSVFLGIDSVAFAFR